jgi:hypothetical protein
MQVHAVARSLHACERSGGGDGGDDIGWCNHEVLGDAFMDCTVASSNNTPMIGAIMTPQLG